MQVGRRFDRVGWNRLLNALKVRGHHRELVSIGVNFVRLTVADINTDKLA